jgi:hypothetical protein
MILLLSNRIDHKARGLNVRAEQLVDCHNGVLLGKWPMAPCYIEQWKYMILF